MNIMNLLAKTVIFVNMSQETCRWKSFFEAEIAGGRGGAAGKTSQHGMSVVLPKNPSD